MTNTLNTGLTTDSGRVLSDSESAEEHVVAELESLGIRYLSRRTSDRVERVRPPEVLLADLVRQPSARVRAAVISLLLAHPEYAHAVSGALDRLNPAQQRTLQLFYTAAVLLQREYASQLQRFVSGEDLPDRFADELGLPASGTVREKLALLGQRHQQQTRVCANWVGTYENTARRLLRSWELEARWKQ